MDMLIPLLPLTDVEIVVYFFNTISRPPVALRLYSRQWGPANISDILNEYREIEPPYLRNTCSVKCTTALKNGRKTYGTQWEEDLKAVFSVVDDFKATDLIRNTANDLATDYELRSLCLKLKKHPSDKAAGIFTRCVKYCQETQATYTLSNAHELAAALTDGTISDSPMPSSPGDTELGSMRKRKRDIDDDGSNDDDADSEDADADGSSSHDGSDDEDDGEDDNDEDDGEYSTPTPVKNRGVDDLAAAYRDI